MGSLRIGMTIDCVVTRLEPYGAWIEADGHEGLVTIPEVSWSRISHPSDVLALGQRLQVIVLAVPESRPFCASVRAVHPEQDPWYAPDLFAMGSEFAGTVERVLEYGCFVSLRPNVSGLLRRDRWVGCLHIGDQVRVRIEAVDVATRKIELSLLSNS